MIDGTRTIVAYGRRIAQLSRRPGARGPDPVPHGFVSHIRPRGSNFSMIRSICGQGRPESMTASDRTELTILQFSDTHLHAAPDSRMRGVPTYETFAAVILQAKRDARWPPDAILVTGDIVQDESRAGYLRFRNMLEPLEVPVFCIPGNHDDPKLMAVELVGGRFQVGGTARLDGWALILLDTFLTGEDAGGLGPKRLRGLEAMLEANRDAHALVCMHHQPIPMGSAWLDGVGLRDAEQFLEIIGRFDNVRGVVWGHVHQASDRTRDNVRFLSAPSTCSQFKPDSEFFALDDKPPGMRWIRLARDGGIETEIAWLEEA